MHKPLRGLLYWASVVVVVFIGVEVGLRFAPQLIPLTYLKRFEPNLRASIGERIGLATERNSLEVERDDGGPPLLIRAPGTKVRLMRPADQGGPAFFRLDENGFCDPENKAALSPRIDIVAIGDSFTACLLDSPENTWPAILAERLDEVIYNLGKGNIGLYEYLQLLKTFGLPRSPAIVIMNVYEGNDLRDADRYWRFREGRSVKAFGDETTRLEDALLGFALSQSSYAWNLFAVTIGKVERLIATILDTKDTSERVNFRYTLDFETKEVAFNTSNTDRDEVRYAGLLAEGELDTTVFDDAIDTFAALASSHDFVPVLLYSPSAHTAYQQVTVFETDEVKETLLNYSTRLRDYFGAKAREHGIIFIDLTAPIQEAAIDLGADQLLYDPEDLHFSKAGNLVFATLVDERLREVVGPARAVSQMPRQGDPSR